MAAFSITIEIIRVEVKNYFEFLYYEPNGYVDKIFLGWLLLGLLSLLVALKHSNNVLNDKKV